MEALTIIPNGEGAWPDLSDSDNWIGSCAIKSIQVAGLDSGTSGGKPSVALRLDMVDPRKPVVVAETTLALFLSAADALKARYGDPR